MATTSQRRVGTKSTNFSPSGRTLKSTPEKCIVCGRSNVELHPYTSQKERVFCRRDHDVTEAMRRMGYSMNTQPDANTAVAKRHRRLIAWLEGKQLIPEDIAKIVIYAEHKKLPR